VGPAKPEPLAVLLRDPDNAAIIGGLWAISVYDWLFIDLIYVPDELRGRGIGSKLMKSAEEIADNRGCVGVRLDTYSFQASNFYEKLGYQVFGKLVEHPRGYERIYFFKVLTDSKIQ